VSPNDNGGMTKNRLAFKDTQVFDWESEPKDERPSEFHTTGFSTASGYYHALDDTGSNAPVPKSHRNATAILLLGLATAIGVGAVGILWLTQLLRG
jgi:hypothetical protein